MTDLDLSDDARRNRKIGQVVEMGSGEEVHEYEHGAECDPTECRL